MAEHHVEKSFNAAVDLVRSMPKQGLQPSHASNISRFDEVLVRNDLILPHLKSTRNISAIVRVDVESKLFLSASPFFISSLLESIHSCER